MTEIDKKIKALKDFIKQKTDQGTANYLGKEIREICGMVETEQCNIDLVSLRFLTDKIEFIEQKLNNENTVEALKKSDLYDREVIIQEHLQIVKQVYFPNAS